MAENTSNGAGKSSLGDIFDRILTTGTNIYTTQTQADAAKRTAGASVMQSLAEMAKSKTTLIVVGVIAGLGVLYLVFRKK